MDVYTTLVYIWTTQELSMDGNWTAVKGWLWCNVKLASFWQMFCWLHNKWVLSRPAVSAVMCGFHTASCFLASGSKKNNENVTSQSRILFSFPSTTVVDVRIQQAKLETAIEQMNENTITDFHNGARENRRRVSRFSRFGKCKSSWTSLDLRLWLAFKKNHLQQFDRRYCSGEENQKTKQWDII